MSGSPLAKRGGFRWTMSSLVLLSLAGPLALAQTPADKPDPLLNHAVPNKLVPPGETPPGPAAPAPADSGLVQTGCSTCSSGLLGAPPLPEFNGASTGCGGLCYPGRKGCDCCYEPKTAIGRLGYGFYQCICCNDPCYEPYYVPVANASFFVDSARPVTHMRLRVDNGWDYQLPDRAEFFWARSDGNGKGPRPPVAGQFEREVDYRDLSLYMETAVDRFAMFVETPYRNLDPDIYNGASGFADLSIGTKSLLLDCELMQFTFQFRTQVPTGNFTRGLGIGHVALEPAFLLALKLTPESYLQGAAAYWIPIGGDQGFQGAVFHYHLSLNRILCRCGNDLQLIGTAEANGWTFLGGQYSDPATGTIRSAKDAGDVLSIGPGLRAVFCNKIDFGVGSAFHVTSDSLSKEFLRAEFRWRF